MNAAIILSIIVVLAIIYSGFRNGLFSSAATLLMLTTGIAIAIEFYRPLAGIRFVVTELGDYAEPMCLGLVFTVAYFLMQVTANVLAPPVVHMRPLVNKLGGIVVSLVVAIMLSGFLGLIFCMLPWTGVSGGELTGETFIGTDLVASGIGRVTRSAGGQEFDAAGVLQRLRVAEESRECYWNLSRILPRLADVYSNIDAFTPMTAAKLEDGIVNGTNLLSDGESGGKGVGPEAMFCPCGRQPYVIGLLKLGDIPYRGRGKMVLAYDAEACHVSDGKPARMVLMGWLAQRAKLTGEVELMTEEQFKQEMQGGKAAPASKK
jgi:hypothetical protein